MEVAVASHPSRLLHGKAEDFLIAGWDAGFEDSCPLTSSSLADARPDHLRALLEKSVVAAVDARSVSSCSSWVHVSEPSDRLIRMAVPSELSSDSRSDRQEVCQGAPSTICSSDVDSAVEELQVDLDDVGTEAAADTPASRRRRRLQSEAETLEPIDEGGVLTIKQFLGPVYGSTVPQNPFSCGSSKKRH
mmetsp:Transcript_48516/g.105680  ORF Transcript_48516/g.105680 Transcript_48516/m.105680 type:complete len:190 (-) Transcript_48516:281-850(-)